MRPTQASRGAAWHRRRDTVAPAIRVTMGALALTFILAACGKVGPVRPPGPPDEITTGRQYPSR